MKNTAYPLEILAGQWDAAPPLSKHGMAAFVEAILAEAEAELSRCANQNGVLAEVKATLWEMIGQTSVLHRRAQSGHGFAAIDLDGRDPSLPQITRAAMLDMETARLFSAFRDRCGSLSARVCEPDAVHAALKELWVALGVLKRRV